MKNLLVILSILTAGTSWAQTVIYGEITDHDGSTIPGVAVFIEGTNQVTQTDLEGLYKLTVNQSGTISVGTYFADRKAEQTTIQLTGQSIRLDFKLELLDQALEEVLVTAKREETQGISYMASVHEMGIYEGKKSELIVLDDMLANTATNNARQVFGKVPGLNIWESDGAGLQLGIGARGLDPNRTSNFNVRQNGYDIAADPLGYPESYYTPPVEALESIEVVRGAASLQYGTQFGGLVNFKMRSGSDKPIELTTRQTAGSFGLFNSFNSIGGQVGRLSYYGFFQYKTANGWRPNSEFDLKTGFGSLQYQLNEDIKIGLEYTSMAYLAHQPGGLTDADFSNNPQQSKRTRNWFDVDWNLAALTFDWDITQSLKLNLRNFGLIAHRYAVGDRTRIDRPDPMQERDLLKSNFQNFGAELRLKYNYEIGGYPVVALAGLRFFNGQTDQMQGWASDGSDADFRLADGNNWEAEHQFPNKNYSIFAEHIFQLTSKFSLTPGARFEHINTNARGFHSESILVPDPITGIGVDSSFQVPDDRLSKRSFLLLGLGMSYKLKDNIEAYSNISQNYRAINFNDLWVSNPNLVVDPNIQDEYGYNIDLGIRGHHSLIRFDVSGFLLNYTDRIGNVQKTDPLSYRVYRYRTNVGNSRHLGLEAFGELSLGPVVGLPSEQQLHVFANIAVTHARYTKSEATEIVGNQVEQVPPYNLKLGASYSIDSFKASWQSGITGQHYSDATNAMSTPTAVEGLIPAYSVSDFAVEFSKNWFGIEAGCNNVFNAMYFTRRATGYPGPGIIPSDGRSFYLTLQVKL